MFHGCNEYQNYKIWQNVSQMDALNIRIINMTICFTDGCAEKENSNTWFDPVR
jgi:hypothetical protein